MKLLLTAALLFTASAGIAFAKGDGRYMASHDATEARGIWITDTKTGRTKWCVALHGDVNYKPKCSPWTDVND